MQDKIYRNRTNLSFETPYCTNFKTRHFVVLQTSGVHTSSHMSSSTSLLALLHLILHKVNYMIDKAVAETAAQASRSKRHTVLYSPMAKSYASWASRRLSAAPSSRKTALVWARRTSSTTRRAIVYDERYQASWRNHT